jgi:tetratricopeptide (TPR) repeat protein
MKPILIFMIVFLTASGAFGLDRAKVREAETPYVVYTAMSGGANLSNAKADLEKRFAASPNDLPLQISLGVVYMNISRDLFPKGVTGYAKKSSDLLESALKNPALPAELRPLVLSYAGSARALAGKEEPNPAGKISRVNDGFRLLDEAVNQYRNDSFYPCFIRANVADGVPVFFNKDEGMKNDLDFLLRESAKDSQFLVKENQSFVYAMLGDWNKRKKKMDDAIAAWKKAVELDPDMKAGGKPAKEMLSVYED